MPPVKPPRDESHKCPSSPRHADTFTRYEDANVVNETKPFYVGHRPKPIKPAPGPAATYVTLYPELVAIAKEHGYALAVHGSVVRDFDLIAVPWTPVATDAITLIKALKKALGAVTWRTGMDEHYPDCSPSSTKPHGRVAYSLHLTENGMDGPYLDISVMPRVGSNLPDDESAMT